MAAFSGTHLFGMHTRQPHFSFRLVRYLFCVVVSTAPMAISCACAAAASRGRRRRAAPAHGRPGSSAAGSAGAAGTAGGARAAASGAAACGSCAVLSGAAHILNDARRRRAAPAHGRLGSSVADAAGAAGAGGGARAAASGAAVCGSSAVLYGAAHILSDALSCDRVAPGSRALAAAAVEELTACAAAAADPAGPVGGAARSPSTCAVELPPPLPIRMGNQRPIYGRVFGQWLPMPFLGARGAKRFVLCRCGWLTHLNAAARAHARLQPESRSSRRVLHYAGALGECTAESACTNHVCTGKSDHHRHRARFVEQQRARRDAVARGEAVLVCVVG